MTDIAHILPNSNAVTFKEYSDPRFNKKSKYDVVFIEDSLVTNKNMYISRIYKKNGNHRYYMTEEYETQVCQGCGQEGCMSRGCRGGWDYQHYFKSTYVGNDLNKAIIELFN